MVDEFPLLKYQKEFVNFLTSQRNAPSTILAYGKDIEQLVVFLDKTGKKEIKEVKKEDLEMFIKKLGQDGYTAKSISRKINSIKTFYRFLKNNNYIVLNPAVEIKHPKYEVKPPRVLSKVEYRALRDACRHDTRTYAIVELFLQTGIRIGELANLTLEDVKENEIIIKPSGKNEQRNVPLNKAAKQALEAYLKIRPHTHNPFLFVTKSGKPLLIRNIRNAIDRFFRLAGITNAKINDLRHTFIAHNLAAGTPINVVAKVVGHKRVSTTEKYLKIVKQMTATAVKLGEL